MKSAPRLFAVLEHRQASFFSERQLTEKHLDRVKLGKFAAKVNIQYI